MNVGHRVFVVACERTLAHDYVQWLREGMHQEPKSCEPVGVTDKTVFVSLANIETQEPFTSFVAASCSENSPCR